MSFEMLKSASASAHGDEYAFDLPAVDPGPQVSTDVEAARLLRLVFGLLPLIPEADRERTGLVIGTRHGCLAADVEFDRSRRDAGGRFASPAAFSRTLPSTSAAEVSLKAGLRGPLLVLAGGMDLAGRRAASWMWNMRLRHVLVGEMREHGAMVVLMAASQGSGAAK